MTTTRKILKNNIILNISHVLSKSINFILILIITRMLGREGYGIYAFAFSFVTMFMVLGNLGLNSLLTRDVAREKSQINSFLGRSIPLLLTLSGGVVLLVNILVSFSGFQPLAVGAIRIFSIYIFFDSLSRHFISVFRAFEQMEFEAITNLTERVLMLLVSFTLWQTEQSLILLLLIFAAVEVIKAIIAFYHMRKFIHTIEWIWFDASTRRMLAAAFPFALMSIFGTVSGRIDTIMLQLFHSESAVGLYNVAHKFIESLLFIPENAALALFPSLTILFAGKTIHLNEKLNRTLLFFSLAALPLTVGLFFLSPQIISLLFEPEFQRSFVALRWLAVALGLIFFKLFFSTILNATGFQNKFALVAGISMLVNIALNYLLIPKYEIFGASLATIASETVAVLLAVYFTVRAIKYKIHFAYIAKPLIAAGMMGAALHLFANLNIFLLAGIGAIVYIASILLLKTISLKNLLHEFHQLKNPRA